MKLCARGGGVCSVDTTPLVEPPRSTTHASVVALPRLPDLAFASDGGPPPTPVPLSTDLLFGPESAVLLADGQAYLRALAATLPARSGISLVGHTAAVGTPDGARQLSLARAEAVRAAILAANPLLDPAAVVATGVGYDRPIVADRDSDGDLLPAAARNRAVVLTVSPARSGGAQ